MAPDPINERDWLAYRYLTGELDDSAWAEFEARLADDVQLQQSLAEMAEMTSALAAGVDVQSRPAIVRRNSSRQWAAVAAAAVLLAGTGWTSSLPFPQQQLAQVESQAAGTDDAQSLLSLWAVLDQFENRQGHEQRSEEWELSGNLDVPNWMLAALQTHPIEDETLDDRPTEAEPSDTL